MSRTLGLWAFGAGVLALALGGLLLGNGNLGIALGPLLGLGLLWAIWKLPMRSTLLGMTFFALALSSPMERPHAGWWAPPWQILAQLFFNNLQSTLHLPFLRFTGMEFLLVYLFVIYVYRRATHSPLDRPPHLTPQPLSASWALSVAAVLWLELYGLARGGDFTQSIWQMRVLLVLPVVAALFAQALQGRKDQQALGRVVVAAALIKTAVGAYFYWAICKPAGLMPPSVTTHSDSILFALAIAVCFTTWWEDPTWKNLIQGSLISAVVLVGISLNDRRLAYVSLGGMVLVVFLMSPWNRAKRALSRGAIVLSPLLLAYALVGWHSKSMLFRPVQVLRSVTVSDSGSEEDSSTEFRNLENHNLVLTIYPHPLLGSGFGHPYREVIKLPDISRAMPFYRYLPHNTVLWLVGVGGWLGFTALWLHLVVGVFVAARAYHRAQSPIDRATLLVAICAVVAYLNQAFGDMGVQTYASVFTVAPAMALAGTVATRVGAFPRKGAGVQR